jgi:hypothetical protein
MNIGIVGADFAEAVEKQPSDNFMMFAL